MQSQSLGRGLDSHFNAFRCATDRVLLNGDSYSLLCFFTGEGAVLFGILLAWRPCKHSSACQIYRGREKFRGQA